MSTESVAILTWHTADISWICAHLTENGWFDGAVLQREWDAMKAVALASEAADPDRNADLVKLVEDWEGWALSAHLDEQNGDLLSFIAKVKAILVAPAVQDAPSDEQTRDWTEDFCHENGNYMNTCSTCKQTFMGYKRRVTCKACAAPVSGEAVARPDLARGSAFMVDMDSALRHAEAFRTDIDPSVIRELILRHQAKPQAPDQRTGEKK